MRIAIVSDIHGNGTAFRAVLKDLRETSPDLTLHGGDLADGGSSPVEIVDTIRNLGWPGVAGNTDEMLFFPPSLTDFAAQIPAMQAFVPAIEAMAAWTRAALGEARMAWLRELPPVHYRDRMALIHASPGNYWRAPGPEAGDDELASIYRPLEAEVAIYGHIHRPYIRQLAGLTIANSGSVGLPYDGDRRASYLLSDDGAPSIRRVEYDVDRERQALAACGIPHAAWVERTLAAARPQMP